jgi:chorismate lyase / 3-hydroxybenzoate synthase
MLTLSYLFSPKPAPAKSALTSTPAFPAPSHTASSAAASGAAALGEIVFGDERVAAAESPLFVATPVLNAIDADLIETWQTDGISVGGRRGALHYRYNEQLLFGCIALPESAAADIQADEANALQRATASAYRQIFALLDELKFPYLWRVWNFIPRINAEGHGLERYRHFNIARQAAFAASGRAVIGNVPAASALGSASGALTIYFFAGRAAPRAIENPRQLSAYHYPDTYGPRSPVFARASAIEFDGGELLLVSGTASIVGHRSLHDGDVRAQTVESLANIDAVLTAANEQTQRRKFARRDLAYKVYIRHAADLAAVRGAVENWLGGPAPIVYLQADICRAELLVEIEASAGHAIQILTQPAVEISVA